MRSKKVIVKNLQIGIIVAICIGGLYAIILKADPELFSSNSPDFAPNYGNQSEFMFEYNTSIRTRTPIIIEPKEAALYLNYFDTYKCPYYSDRADLIAPEINRLAQMMRAFNMPIIFYTQTVKETELDEEVKELSMDEKSLKLNETSPLLDDKCLYGDYDAKPAKETGEIHHDIKYSTKIDYFVHSHAAGVKLAKKLGVKYLIAGGMRCNFWLPPFFDSLKENGIKPMYIYDLSDVAYLRATQRKKLDTHNKALEHFWKWVVENYGAIVNHFSLIDRLIPKNSLGKNIDFDGNKAAYYFIEYFEDL